VIGIVNYGMGNIRSVVNAIESVGGTCLVANRPDQLAEVDRIILPGVGAFAEAMARLREQCWIDPLREQVFAARKPFLGICLGMQLLADRSNEHGEHAGLGWVGGEVRRIEPGDSNLRVPHVGWNSVQVRDAETLFRGTAQNTPFYFVHSYHFVPTEPSSAIALTDYGAPITAAVQREHVFGTQFHPEKSHHAGLRLLENFCEYRKC
jgi:glutamine amidotransferase